MLGGHLFIQQLVLSPYCKPSLVQGAKDLAMTKAHLVSPTAHSVHRLGLGEMDIHPEKSLGLAVIA